MVLVKAPYLAGIDAQQGFEHAGGVVEGPRRFITKDLHKVGVHDISSMA